MSFRRFGAVCAVLFAACTFLYALLLLVGSETTEFSARLGEVVSARALNEPASLLLGISGVVATAAVAAVYEITRGEAGAWARWSAALGLLAAAMMAAHGFWDYLRVPVLLFQWDSGNVARQEAISTFAGVPNPVDPRGLGAFLFMGAFALVSAGLLARRTGARGLVGPAGLIYGALLIAAFASGFVGPDATRAGLAALSLGVAGPVWWLLVTMDLWKSPVPASREPVD
jgi:hypothetical protein